MPVALCLRDGLDLGRFAGLGEQVAGGGALQARPGRQAHQPRARKVGVVKANGVPGQVISGEGHCIEYVFDVVGEDGIEET